MTHRVLRTWMRGHVKVDDNDMWVQMSGHVNSVGQVRDAGGGLSGCGKCVEMGNPDVSSTRCNRLRESQEHGWVHIPMEVNLMGS